MLFHGDLCHTFPWGKRYNITIYKLYSVNNDDRKYRHRHEMLCEVTVEALAMPQGSVRHCTRPCLSLESRLQHHFL